jgi:hypothetical protein
MAVRVHANGDAEIEQDAALFVVAQRVEIAAGLGDARDDFDRPLDSLAPSRLGLRLR